MQFIDRWGLSSLSLLDILHLLSHRARDAYWLTSFNLACAIAAGVILLSFFECTLLRDAVEDLGGSGYIIGNYFVHYYPVLRVYTLKPKKVGTHISPSLSLLVCYLAVERAEAVYGCPLPHAAITYGALLLIPATIALYYWLHIKPGPTQRLEM